MVLCATGVKETYKAVAISKKVNKNKNAAQAELRTPTCLRLEASDDVMAKQTRDIAGENLTN